MPDVLFLTTGNEEIAGLTAALGRDGYRCAFTSSIETLVEKITDAPPAFVIVEAEDGEELAEVCQQIKNINRRMPVMALVAPGVLEESRRCLDLADDFMLAPFRSAELALRAKRLHRRVYGAEGNEVVRCGDLVIDMANCEMTIGNRVVLLTFKEYELLKLLATNRGRVFTREALLNRVWGHDYFGGDRTVDVHVRRLRSKIEDPEHTFIETVRNIGYRFVRAE